ncbi:MAG: cellulase family glycosylhydrolase [Opitutaceae bacterium]|jgi:endoglucanase
MNPTPPTLLVAATLAAFFHLAPAHAATVTQTVNSGSDTAHWGTALWGTPAAVPTAGNDYISDGAVTSALRTGNFTNSAFVGNTLTMRNGATLVVKTTNTTANFILESGAVLAMSENGTDTILGSVLVAASQSATFNSGDSGRILAFNAVISGAGNIAIAQSTNTGGYTGEIRVQNTSSTFSGTWTVNGGVLAGTTAGAFGTGDFVVNNNGKLDIRANFGGPSTTSSLTLNTGGLLDLSNGFSYTFAAVTVGGTALPPGTYTYAGLTAAQRAFFINGTDSFTVLGSGAVPPPTMIGVNLSGAESGTVLPGTYGTNYIYPSPANIDYYKARGLELIRLPFKWERIQPTLLAPLNTAELARLDAVFDAIEARGMRVILDLHNYGRYSLAGTTYIVGSPQVSRAAFNDVWTRLADHFKARDCLWAYGLMNEPHGMGTYTWKDSAQGAINAIRTVDTTHAILVPGDSWSGAHSWLTASANLADLTDPADNLIFEAHQYFDNDSSGIYDQSYDGEGAYPTVGVDRLTGFVNWCQTNGVRGYIGEFGTPDSDPRWNTVLENTLAYLQANQISGTYWAGGPWWGTYSLSSEMRAAHDEAPQMSVLQNYGDGPGTGHWPPFTWYGDAIASGLTYSYSYVYQSATALLTTNFAETATHYSGSKSIRLNYTIPSGGYAGAGMHIEGGVNLAADTLSGQVLSFYAKGTVGASLKLFLITTAGTNSAKVATTAYATLDGTWRNIKIPLSQFIGTGFDGTQRVKRIQIECYPTNNTAHEVYLDQFVVETPDKQAPTVSVNTATGGTGYTVAAPVGVVATASDTGGAIDFVEFILDGKPVGIDDTAPYAATITLATPGAHRLTAVAFDRHGNPARSNVMTLTATP